MQDIGCRDAPCGAVAGEGRAGRIGQDVIGHLIAIGIKLDPGSNVAAAVKLAM